MIRFPCPRCQRILKAPERYAGVTLVCPRCQEPAAVPPAGPTGPATPATPSPEEPGGETGAGLFPTTGGRMRWAVAGVAGVGVLSLALAVAAPLLPAPDWVAPLATRGACVLVPCSLVALLVMLYGLGTGCPACGKWWARTEGETECVSREVCEAGGTARVRSRRRTTYRCRHCGHAWSATFTDEYQGSVRDRQARRP
jgi:hypothetical protein